MRTRKFRLLQLSLAVCMQTLATIPTAAMALEVVSTNFAGKTVLNNEPLIFDFDRFPTPEEGTLAIFVGPTDIGALMRVSGATQLTYPSAEVPLTLGAAEVIVYVIKDPATWVEVKRIAMTVVAPPVASRTSFSPKLDLNGNAVRQTVSASDRPDATSTVARSGLQGGVGITHAGEGWDARLQANIVGSSDRNQALRFGDRMSAAEKVDLASYVIEAGTPDSRVSLGHVAYGNNPLLLSGISNRGLVASQRINQYFDVSVGMQNGSTIVGFDQLAGIYQDRHHFTAATFGWEVLPMAPRTFRLELTYLDAAITPSQPSVNAAQIQDTSRSHGFGLRVLGNALAGRLTGEAAYAQSAYKPVADTFTPAGPGPTRNAYLIEGNYQIVQGWEVAQGWPLSLAARARRDYAEPLYRSLGAGFGADYVQDVAAVTGSLGAVQGSAQLTQRRDNVLRSPILLRNNVDNAALSLNVPLGQIFPPAAGENTSWWPALSLGYQRAHQFASDLPAGLNAADVANILTNSQNMSLSWFRDPFTWGVSINRNVQDNRQPGRENADIESLSVSLNASWRVSSNFSVSSGYGPTRTHSRDTGLTRMTRNPQFGFNWLILDQWHLAGNYNVDRSFDTQNLSDGRGGGASTTLTRTFRLGNPFGPPLPVQVGLRHYINYNVTRTSQGALNFENLQRTNGFSINLSTGLF